MPEYEFIEKLLSAEGEKALENVIAENEEKITDELLKTLSGIVAQSQEQGQGEKLSSQDQEMFERMEQVYSAVLRFSMKKNMG